MNDNIKIIGKAGALALLSQIPIASAFSTFVNEFVNSKWQERIELWQKEFIDRISNLDKKIERLIKQQKNFASILATAQQNALTEFEEEKIPLYVNSVINSIKSEKIDNTKIHIFINMLKDFTNLHLKVLNFLSNPPKEAWGFNGAVQTEIFNKPKTILDLFKKENSNINDFSMINIITEDLYKKSLITIDSLNGNNSFLHSGKFNKKTTHLGDEFLKFINN